jgi:hypothetical protein
MPSQRGIKNPVTLTEAARFFAPFLARNGVPSECLLRPVSDGPQNRVYGVESPGKKWALKWYGLSQAAFARYFTEWAFYDLLSQQGLPRVPQPLAWDEDRALALFAWVEGRPLQASEINPAVMAEVMAFLLAVNRARPYAAGRTYPLATGAVFSLADRFAEMERLVARVARAVPGQTKPARQLREELDAAWQIVANLTLDRWQRGRWEMKRKLPLAERCLAPADFGLANALRGGDGRLVFLDFDGAGWQDPAWVLAGIFARTDLAPPLDFWKSFAVNFARVLGQDPQLVRRAESLWPVCLFRRYCLTLLEYLQRKKICSATAAGKTFRRQMETLSDPRWWLEP